MSPQNPHIALFVTCLVDLFRPNIGFAAVKLLTEAGCQVEVPLQSCCGQPAYNSGDEAGSQALARQLIQRFEAYDYVVIPSGSCAAMLRVHYPTLLRADPLWHKRAERFAVRCYELLSFLQDVLKRRPPPVSYAGRATYHDSCSGLRELGIHAQPRSLLQRVTGLSLTELAEPEACCGFGGTFCVKYPEISERLVSDKAADIAQTGADTVLGGDLGCLLNIAGRLSRLNQPLRVYHAAEVLAGLTDEVPGIAQPAPKPRRSS